jgi:hypothetical protein
MKRSMFLVPALAMSLLAGGAAFAQPKGVGAEPQPVKPGTPSLYTRAQVKAECDAAVKAGKTVSGECPLFGAPAAGGTSLTREQVRAECDAMRKAGKTPASGECPN